jgi:hypothetical protein
MPTLKKRRAEDEHNDTSFLTSINAEVGISNKPISPAAPAVSTDTAFCLQAHCFSLRLEPPGLFSGGLHRSEAEGFRHTGAIGRVGFRTVGDVPLLHLETGVAHGAGGILEESLLLGPRHLAK